MNDTILLEFRIIVDFLVIVISYFLIKFLSFVQFETIQKQHGNKKKNINLVSCYVTGAR